MIRPKDKRIEGGEGVVEDPRKSDDMALVLSFSDKETFYSQSRRTVQSCKGGTDRTCRPGRMRRKIKDWWGVWISDSAVACRST